MFTLYQGILALAIYGYLEQGYELKARVRIQDPYARRPASVVLGATAR
jgi:hypothetical protein